MGRGSCSWQGHWWARFPRLRAAYMDPLQEQDGRESGDITRVPQTVNHSRLGPGRPSKASQRKRAQGWWGGRRSRAGNPGGSRHTLCHTGCRWDDSPDASASHPSSRLGRSPEWRDFSTEDAKSISVEGESKGRWRSWRRQRGHGEGVVSTRDSQGEPRVS